MTFAFVATFVMMSYEYAWPPGWYENCEPLIIAPPARTAFILSRPTPPPLLWVSVVTILRSFVCESGTKFTDLISILSVSQLSSDVLPPDAHDLGVNVVVSDTEPSHSLNRLGLMLMDGWFA